MQRITWWPGDYLRDTGDLSLMEHGAYRVLLDHYYATDGRLKADQAALFRICRAMTEDEQAAVGKVVKMFFTVDAEGCLHNKKADEIIAENSAFIASAQAAGKAGAAVRWGKGKSIANPMANPIGNPMRTPIAASTTTTTNTKPKKHSATANAVALPDWLPKDAWDAFVETRGRIRAPLTDRAKTLAIRELSKLRDQGHDCRAVLEQSVLNGWRGLFAPKGGQPKRDQFEGAL